MLRLVKPLVPYVRRRDWPTDIDLFDALRSAMPEFDVVAHGDIEPGRLNDVTVAIIDGPSAEQITAMPGLAFVQSTWAGVERILPVVPDGVAVARMIDPQLSATMAEAVLAWTLYLHRDMPRYARQQSRREWVQHDVVRAADRRVGIVGLGVLGRAAALTVAAQGFPTAGWSRSAKEVDGVECLDGVDGLDALLARSDIVVNLLPHTVQTTGLLGGAAFAAMPDGASLINFGRGPTVDDGALLDAADSGQLGHAVLDVFDTEPLPADHPFWTHESITVLPHVTGPTSRDTAALIAADNVRRFLADGELPTDALVDRARGY